MNETQKQTLMQFSVPVESILVVKRSLLFTQDAWHGMNTTNLDQFIKVITKHKEFLPRPEMEQDPKYKQIIP